MTFGPRINLAGIGIAAACSILIASQADTVALGTIIVAGCVMLGVVVFAGWGLRVTTQAVFVAALFLLPMNALQVAGALTVGDVMFAAAGALVLLAHLSTPVRPDLRDYTPFLVGAWLIVLGGLVGTLAGSREVAGLPDLVRFAVSTVPVLLVFAFYRPSRPALRAMIWAYVAGSVVSTLVGIVAIRDATTRSLGLTSHSNHFGLITLLAFGAALGLALSSRGLQRQIARVAVVVLAIGIVFSGSRAALMGTFTVIAVLLVVSRKGRLIAGAATVVAVLVSLVTLGVLKLPGPDSITRLFGSEASASASNRERTDALSATIDVIESHPITGAGFSAVKFGHNVYLQLLAAGGLLALAGVSALGLAILRLVRRRPQSDLLFAGMFCGYASYLATAVVYVAIWDRYIWTYVGVMVALAALSRREEPERARPQTPGIAVGA